MGGGFSQIQTHISIHKCSIYIVGNLFVEDIASYDLIGTIMEVIIILYTRNIKYYIHAHSGCQY